MLPEGPPQEGTQARSLQEWHERRPSRTAGPGHRLLTRAATKQQGGSSQVFVPLTGPESSLPAGPGPWPGVTETAPQDRFLLRPAHSHGIVVRASRTPGRSIWNHSDTRETIAGSPVFE